MNIFQNGMWSFRKGALVMENNSVQGSRGEGLCGTTLEDSIQNKTKQDVCWRAFTAFRFPRVPVSLNNIKRLLFPR